MGYEINSPVKQIWLPLDADWLVRHSDTHFKEFSELYKEKYGIDLHDIFALVKMDVKYAINIKVDLIGAYSVGLLDQDLKTKFASPQAVTHYESLEQGDSAHALITITVGSTDVAHGFSISLPSKDNEVNSIDDLLISAYIL